MLKYSSVLGLIFLLLSVPACTGRPFADSQVDGGFHSDFSTLDHWQDDSTKTSPRSYHIKDGKLFMSTRAKTRDRVKVMSTERFAAGRYTWRVYAPTMGVGDQASIGAFLYQSDKREVDFEIGYGRADVRKKLNAQDDDLVCYCTTQGGPYSTSQFLVKREAWYDLAIDLDLNEKNQYQITWLINGKPVKEQQTVFGPEVTFTAHCSVENLDFLGDHIPSQKNYAIFDSFSFVPKATD